MKKNFIHLLLAFLWMLVSATATAQTTENFNSRPSVPTNQVKAYLQNNCWFFPDFDVNAGFTPGIEGDGAMVSGPAAHATQNSGIYSPVLNVPGSISVSFKYAFNNVLQNNMRRWLKIYLTDQDNNIQGLLDSIEFSAISPTSLYTYNKTFPQVGSGLYKLYINYQGNNGSLRIAIDELNISASLLYYGGCNTAPVAINDIVTGAQDHTASAIVVNNDYDANNEGFTPYLVTPSPDGTVVFNYDGSFTFTPNSGFNGSSTSFTYKVCDNGFAPLCSNDATVTINFSPASMLPISLIDLKGLYKMDGNVEISWTTTFEQNSDRFEIERSLDGSNWIKAGSVKAMGNSSDKRAYNFIDNVSRNTANKKDLYYRLKLVDIDGKNSVSRILIVRVYNTRSLKMVSVTPNPAKNDIAVNVQLNEKSYISMRIVNSNGKEVMRKSAKANEGNNSFLMDGSAKLPAGMYILEVVINSKESMVVKLIKE